MRVLQLTQRFPPAIGGVEDHVLRLSRKLHDSGVDVAVATTDLRRDVPFERLGSDMDPQPFPVTRYRAHKFVDAPHGLGIASPSMLLGALGHRVDLLHAHAYGYFPTWAGSLARSLDGAALVITPHSDAGSPTFAKRAFDRVAVPLTLERAARIIAVTEHEASALRALGVPGERIAVIPNGVDLGEFHNIPESREMRDGVTGLFVGRLYPRQKGLGSLVDALALVPRSTGLELRLVGEDWGGAELVHRRAAELQVDDRVRILGPLSRADLLREYANADFLVLPSLFEPFGIVLLEAMAAGLPVVASRVGGIPQVVAEGETALLSAPGDSAELAEAMMRLCADPKLRASLGRKGRERSVSFSWDALLPRVLAVYRAALQERGL